MTPTDLSRLHDIVPPPSAPLWPPAPGMIMLLALAVATLLILATRALIRWQRNRYRREALAELRRIERGGLRHTDGSPMPRLAALLKRTALTAYPRAEVASLTGPAWHAFLDRAAGTTAFATAAGALLETAAYDPRAELTPGQTRTLIAATRDWIKHHGPTLTPAPRRGNAQSKIENRKSKIS